jgi:hypothetical protein
VAVVVLRVIIAGICGGIAWQLGWFLFFGPALQWLADPGWQSAKLLGVFSVNPAAPRMYYAPWITWVGVIAIGILWGWAYTIIGNSGKRHWWDRGVVFGLVGWMLMVPWLEFYVHWNLLLEPAALVGLDMVCWAAVLMVVGLTIAGFDHLLKRVGHGE